MATYIMDLGNYGDHVTGCVELEADSDEDAVAALKDVMPHEDHPIIYRFDTGPVREIRIYIHLQPEQVTDDLIGDVWENDDADRN